MGEWQSYDPAARQLGEAIAAWLVDQARPAYLDVALLIFCAAVVRYNARA
jgi:hypothetical protein